MDLGAHDYQILATEGYQSTGSSDITVREGTSCLGGGNAGGGSYSETIHCSGVIGFGHTDDCFSCNCSGTGSASSSGSSSSSTSSSSSSSSSSGGNSGGGSCQCNWWGTPYSVCTTTSAWGWENNQGCTGAETCNGQSGDGGLVCN